MLVKISRKHIPFVQGRQSHTILHEHKEDDVAMKLYLLKCIFDFS